MSKHRRKSVNILLVIALIIILVLVFFYFQGGTIHKETIYTETFQSTDRVIFESLDSSIIRCSKDGIAKLSLKNETIWDKTFNYKNPKLLKEGRYLLVGDISGQDLILLNEDGMVQEYHVNYPIVMFDINDNGIVAIVQAKEHSNIIQIFNENGEELIYRETYFENDGYPLDIELSSNGNNMITSYVYTKDDSIKTNISFFDFSNIGHNFDERIIGGFVLEDTIIPDVMFIDNDYIAAIGDNKVVFYSLQDKPIKVKELILSNEVSKISKTDNSLLILYGKSQKPNDEDLENYLVSYNKMGEEISKIKFEDPITFLKGEGPRFFIGSSWFVREYDNEKLNWEITLDKEIKDIFSIKDKYLIVYNNEFELFTDSK